MGWNGSNSVGRVAPRPPQKNETHHSSTTTLTVNYRAIFAGLIVIVLGGAALWWFLCGREPTRLIEPHPVKPSGKIASVQPTVLTQVVAKVKAPAKTDPNARPTKPGEILNGYILLHSGRMHRIKGEYTNTTAAAKASYEIFNHHCDNEIACYLTLEPGQSLVGTPRYNGRFTKEFLDSLKEPLIAPHDASPEDKQLYEAVRDAKIELKAAYDRGEDIEKIMLDTRRELQEMGSYKQELERNIRQLVRETANNSDDVKSIVDAANKMLEAKGIAPIEFGPIAQKRFEHYLQQKIKSVKENDK